MSQFENSEIMQEYARIISQDTIVKEAGWRDVMEVLGLEAAGIGGAAMLGGGVAAAMGLTGGAAAVPLAILGTAWLAYDIFQAATKADNTVGELIERLESLDPTSWVSWMGFKEGDENAAKKIEQWISDLEQHKKAIGPGEISANMEERGKAAGRKVDALIKLSKYLDQMKFEWQEVKPRLTDWGWDPEQTEITLKNTITATKDAIQEARVGAQKATGEFIAKAKETGGKDYKGMATKVKSMYDQLTKMYGQAPTFDNAVEKNGFDLANKILAGQVTMKDIELHGSSMKMLHDVMARALNTKKSEVVNRALSKRALTLGDGTKIPTTSGPAGVAKKEKGRRPMSRRNTEVTSLQRSLNYLTTAYGTGANKIAEDGIYGPRTAAALQALTSQQPKVARWAGITQTDPSFMKSNPGVVKSIGSALDRLAGHIQQQQPGGQPSTSPQAPQYGVQYGGGRYDVQEQPGKWNPTGAEILAALSNRFIDGTRANQWLENRGFDRQRQIKLVNEVFQGPNGLPPASEWDMQGLKQYVKTNYRGSLGRYQVF